MKRRVSYPGNRRRRGYWIFAGAFLCLFWLFLEYRLHPVLEEVTYTRAIALASETVHGAVLNILEDENLRYGDLVEITRNEEGGILALTSDTLQMNYLKAKVAEVTQEKLDAFTYLDTYIPFGTLLGGELFRGKGPGVPVRISMEGSVTADFESDFSSGGINQTRHRIVLQLHVHIYTYLVGVKAETAHTTDIPVAETVIVGGTPQFYASP